MVDAGHVAAAGPNFGLAGDLHENAATDKAAQVHLGVRDRDRLIVCAHVHFDLPNVLHLNENNEKSEQASKYAYVRDQGAGE